MRKIFTKIVPINLPVEVLWRSAICHKHLTFKTEPYSNRAFYVLLPSATAVCHCCTFIFQLKLVSLCNTQRGKPTIWQFEFELKKKSHLSTGLYIQPCNNQLSRFKMFSQPFWTNRSKFVNYNSYLHKNREIGKPQNVWIKWINYRHCLQVSLIGCITHNYVECFNSKSLCTKQLFRLQIFVVAEWAHCVTFYHCNGENCTIGTETSVLRTHWTSAVVIQFPWQAITLDNRGTTV